MKKIILLMMMCTPIVLSAQGNGISVMNLTTGAGTVTFHVRWDRDAMPPQWVDSAWVFVDYNNEGITTRLPLDAGATLTETSAAGVGKVIEVPGYPDGVWVVGNARSAGSFSATVRLLTAVATADLTGVCAYASNYPPVGLYMSATEIAFTGTLPYIVTIKKDDDVTTELRTVDDSPLFTVPAGYTAQSFTDATGAPGVFSFGCVPGVIDGEEN
jgi:hypothetical protein